ncbi:MAG: MEKHLA domain-containing protein [Candidatus Melainabacteria bacterium]|jgi:hypothetical protein|nr:MEKHLA domain-containing protein [Candidatus Melainabacteria bacterium]
MQFSPELQSYIKLVLTSYQNYTGTTLAKDINDLYNADFISASHSFYDDNLTRFVFANLKAQELWQMTWDEFLGLESKYSANPNERSERDELLAKVKQEGIIYNYSGMRVSKTGQEFLVKDATVWNVNDSEGKLIGQAVKFAS